MKKFIFILLLFLLSCESINGGKTGEKEELLGNILIARLIQVMQLPKFIYVVETLFYSDKYTTETAREVCLQITNKKVEFQTEYNPSADYSL